MSNAHHYHFDVTMSCTGCSGAIDRVLKKTPDITSYTVNLEQQTADVYTEKVSYEDVLERIKKTGKEVRKGTKDGVEAEV